MRPRRRPTKTPNHPAGLEAKIDLRRWVLERVRPARVLDAFAGKGAMYSAVWHQAESYAGIDRFQWPAGDLRWVGDNRRVLRCIDLQPFNVFDLNSFGDPWYQALIVAARRDVKPEETIGMLFTSGGLGPKLGSVSHAGLLAAGLERSFRPRSQDQRADFVEMAERGIARRLRCEILERRTIVRAHGAEVFYSALTLRGLPDPLS